MRARSRITISHTRHSKKEVNLAGYRSLKEGMQVKKNNNYTALPLPLKQVPRPRRYFRGTLRFYTVESVFGRSPADNQRVSLLLALFFFSFFSFSPTDDLMEARLYTRGD